ncbi:MAG: NgoFVII family restriction endonuclease [Sandaracinaceae bacterium]|nr:NgoFVII family restriction endonuclease [Sandaracinaceae bacterium]
MPTSIVTNAFGAPLVDRLEALCAGANEISIASAFITADLVRAALVPAAKRGARVRVLTGTYANFNRKALFEGLLRHSRSERFDARVWEGDGSGSFHAKLYVWRNGGRGEAWIGSANLTAGGMNNEGEIVLAERGPWTSPTLRMLRGAFENAWAQGRPIDAAFVASYREAARPPPDARVRTPRAARRLGAGPSDHAKQGRMVVATVTNYFDEDSPILQRVESVVFPRIELPWYRARGSLFKTARADDLVLFVEVPTRTVCVARVHAVRADGEASVLAYYPRLVVRSRAWNETARRALRSAGVSVAGTLPRARWLDAETTERVLRAVRQLPSR